MESSKSSKFLRRVISPAIRGQTCPICLENLHGRTSAVLVACHHAYCETCIGKWSLFRRKCPLCSADFDSWFLLISLSAGTFRRHRLPAVERQNPRRFRVEEGGSSWRQRLAIDSARRRTTPLPWRRSFGRSGYVAADVVARRKLQWRQSIYERGLKAVPLAPIHRLEQNELGRTGGRERILGRIEAWIQRELQAILGDPDPSVIVRVATSLYITMLENKNEDGDRLLTELRPFLLEKTDMFWHELREFINHGNIRLGS